jgi:hypothetical protein
MITKKEKLKSAIEKGDHKEALSIARGFRREFNPDQQRILQIAYESITGKENFYRSLGIDVEENMKLALELLKDYK